MSLILFPLKPCYFELSLTLFECTSHSTSSSLSLHSTLPFFGFWSAFIFRFIYRSLSCKQLDVCLLCYYYCCIFEVTFTSSYPGAQFGSLECTDRFTLVLRTVHPGRTIRMMVTLHTNRVITYRRVKQLNILTINRQ